MKTVQTMPSDLARLLAVKDLDLGKVREVLPIGEGHYRVHADIVARVSLREDGAAARPLPAGIIFKADTKLEQIEVLVFGIRLVSPEAGGHPFYAPFIEALGLPDTGFINPMPPPEPAPTRLYQKRDEPQPHWMRVDQGVGEDPAPEFMAGHDWPQGTLLRCPDVDGDG